MDDRALKPCPFCGSTNVDPEGWAATDADGNNLREGPCCDDCNASADSVEAWNTRAADRLSEREGWREIESDPPSPGQRIIAATPDGSHWSFSEAFFDEVVEEWTDVRSDRYVRPTHWMPLPSPPGKLER